jgi:L-fuconolactonase
MLKIDAHQHFWTFSPVRDAWITPNMEVIAKGFMPKYLKPHLEKFDFEGCVVVQSSESVEENLFQQTNAKQNSFIKGIVA